MLAMAAVLGATIITLSHCRAVTDSVTGVDFRSGRLSGRSACVKQCNENYKAATRAEEQRHRDAIRACGSNSACKDAENALHRTNQDAINIAKQECKKNCYNEGDGSAGR